MVVNDVVQVIHSFFISCFALFLGLGRQDFMSLLTKDLDEQESARIAKEEEQERAMYSV